MSAFFRKRSTQRGAALILMMTVIVMGIAWYTVSAVGNAARSTADREIATGKALHAAKRALLAYAAQYASRTDHDHPGRMPCPESLSSIGTADEGDAINTCSNTAIRFGRLPWRTLGIEPLRDGDGELLWYVLSPNFRGPTFPATPVPDPLPATPPSPRPNWVLNLSTPGTIPYNGALYGAVALIIAPGAALNTMSDPGSPTAPCTRVNQQANRYSSPLVVGNFFECGNATGAYANPGTSTWTNDRVISISADEWAAAISPGVADRLQRQVVPALENWRANESYAHWGYRFLPHASTFGKPADNDLCGDTISNSGLTEGLPPTARVGSSNCSWWSYWDINKLSGSGNVSSSCFSVTTGMTCTVSYSGSPTIQVAVGAWNVAASFRGRITSSDVTTTAGVISNFQHGLYSNQDSGIAYALMNIALPTGSSPAVVRINHLPDAAVLSSDPRMVWFVNNGWDRHVYYSISGAVRAYPQGAICNVPGDAGCLTASGLASDSGNPDDKRLVLVLMGRPLASQQSQPINDPRRYLESHTVGTPVYAMGRINSTFNDRGAVCPFQYAGTPASACP